jgi:hypothetical protein
MLEVINMTWKDILKAPYVNDYVIGNSPLVFIDDPTPLPQEIWDNQFKRNYEGGGYGQNKTTDTSMEISNYGRVKIDGQIQRPKESKSGFKTLIRGDTSVAEYRGKNAGRYIGTDKTNDTRAFVPYSVTVDVLNRIGYNIPDNAELLGEYNITYGKWIKTQPKKKTPKSTNTGQLPLPPKYRPTGESLPPLSKPMRREEHRPKPIPTPEPRDTNRRKAPPARRGR